MIEKLWAERYRPQTLDEYIFQNPDHKRQIEAMVSEKEFAHLLFAGPAGTGKTSLAQLLVNSVGIDQADLFKEDASFKNSVEFIRNEIFPFAYSYPLGRFKVIWLEEADRLSQVAQDNLKTLLEEASDTCRFIFTCNNVNRFMPAIRSRFHEFHLKAPDRDEVMVKAGTILATEGIEFDVDTLDKFVSAGWPDVRRIINSLQKATKGSKRLGDSNLDQSTGDWTFGLLDHLTKGDLHAARKLVCENAQREEFEGIYRFLYENCHRVPAFKKHPDLLEESIVTIANYLYKNAIVADPEINFAACMVELSQSILAREASTKRG